MINSVRGLVCSHLDVPAARDVLLIDGLRPGLSVPLQLPVLDLDFSSARLQERSLARGGGSQCWRAVLVRSSGVCVEDFRNLSVITSQHGEKDINQDVRTQETKVIWVKSAEK